MIASLVVTAGLLVQAAGSAHAPRAPRPPDPVRVWRTDSIAYVSLREPGHLVLLSVDPIGRITVLFPFGPYDSTGVDAGVPFAVPVPPEAQGNPATLVAVRSRWAFDFAALQGGAGGTWDYQDAWLLQPTAGDPLGALLDIADRVTDGRPYDYGGVKYSRDGSVAALGVPVQPDVCLSCVRQGTPVAIAPAPVPTSAVDCSSASLTNAFCGVNSGSVSITSAPATAAAQQAAYQQAAPVYVPYYVPLIVHGGRRRFEPSFRPPAPAPRPSVGAAYPIAPRLVVPSPSQLGTFTGRHH
ncbi:MAG TPA: hypothetical protein VGJ80_09010 [Gemmatimonadales bacterium]|jgi:hypothetical protein